MLSSFPGLDNLKWRRVLGASRTEIPVPSSGQKWDFSRPSGGRMCSICCSARAKHKGFLNRFSTAAGQLARHFQVSHLEINNRDNRGGLRTVAGRVARYSQVRPLEKDNRDNRNGWSTTSSIQSLGDFNPFFFFFHLTPRTAITTLSGSISSSAISKQSFSSRFATSRILSQHVSQYLQQLCSTTKDRRGQLRHHHRQAQGKPANHVEAQGTSRKSSNTLHLLALRAQLIFQIRRTSTPPTTESRSRRP